MKFKRMLPQFHFEIERWKYLIKHDVYISTFGRFKDTQGHILSPTANNNYLVFRGELVHRLVLSTFAPVPNFACLTVDHLDHNTRNNKLSNLQWVTKEENQARERRDAENNKNIKPVDSKTIYLNGTEIAIDTAKTILYGSKDLQTGKAKIDKIFTEIATGAVKSTKISIGNYTIELIEK